MIRSFFWLLMIGINIDAIVMKKVLELKYFI